MMFLAYRNGMRVVVHTANLIQKDWDQKTQGLELFFYVCVFSNYMYMYILTYTCTYMYMYICTLYVHINDCLIEPHCANKHFMLWGE